MLGEVYDLDILTAVDLVPQDEGRLTDMVHGCGKLTQQHLSTHIVEREQFALDVQRSILQTAFAITECPQTGVHEAGPGGAPGQILVLEKAGL
jgi:hypothetical protein